MRLKEISNLQDALLSIIQTKDVETKQESSSDKTVSLVWSTMTKLVDFPIESDRYSPHGLVKDDASRERLSLEGFLKREAEMVLLGRLVLVHGLGQTRFAEELHSQLVVKINAYVITAQLEKEPKIWQNYYEADTYIRNQFGPIDDPAEKKIIVVADGWSNLTGDQQKGASEFLKRLAECPRVQLIVTMDSGDKHRIVLEGVQCETFELDISECDEEIQKSLRSRNESKMERRERERYEAAGSYSQRFFYPQSISQRSNDQNKFLNAVHFAQFIAESGDGSRFVLSCAPGLGKSENLRHIENALQRKLSDYRIIRLDLPSCRTELKKLADVLNEDTVHSFIASVIKSQPEKDKVEGGKVVLLLDAFDEICPRSRVVVVELLKLLKKMKLKTLITTRPQEEKVVAEALEVDSVFKLDFISKDGQPKFIAGVWNDPGKKELAEKLLERVKSSRAIEIWGTPLNLHMLAELSPNGVLNEEIVQGGDFYGPIIKRHIQKTISKFNAANPNRTDSDDEEDFSESYDRVQEFAVDVFLRRKSITANKSDENKHIHRFPFLVANSDKNELEFTHKTYAEHLVAVQVVRKLNEEKCFVNEDECKKIFDDEEHGAIREFVNMLKEKK